MPWPHLQAKITTEIPYRAKSGYPLLHLARVETYSSELIDFVVDTASKAGYTYEETMTAVLASTYRWLAKTSDADALVYSQEARAYLETVYQKSGERFEIQ